MKNAIIDKVSFMIHAEAAYNRSIQQEEIKTCTCYNCSKVVEYKDNGSTRDFLGNPPVYNINLGRGESGSGFLDGCDINFEICNDCLVGIIKTFSLQGIEAIQYSGSYPSKEDYEALCEKLEQ